LKLWFCGIPCSPVIAVEHTLLRVEALRIAVWQLEHNANTRLTLEVLMLSLPSPQD
jgi:hypothetical protein